MFSCWNTLKVQQNGILCGKLLKTWILFPPKIVNYDLGSNMPISQPKFQTQTHGYHSLRNEGTRLWAALPNACNKAKDISTFNDNDNDTNNILFDHRHTNWNNNIQ